MGSWRDPVQSSGRGDHTGSWAEAPVSSQVLHPVWHIPQERRPRSGATLAEKPLNKETEPRKRGRHSTLAWSRLSLPCSPRPLSPLHASSGLTVSLELGEGESGLCRKASHVAVGPAVFLRKLCPCPVRGSLSLVYQSPRATHTGWLTTAEITVPRLWRPEV